MVIAGGDASLRVYDVAESQAGLGGSLKENPQAHA